MIPSIAQDTLKPESESVPSHDNFHTLVSELSRILGPSSGLTSEDVDIEKLTRRMQSYISNAKEWSKYAFSDFSRGYTRNLVDEGNGKSNLLVLVWSPGKGSLVHDHADAHCLMKILKGTLKETKFNYPKNNATPPEIIQETIYKENQVTYMSDDLGIHKISNPDPHNVAVSLHLYTPPNAAREGCYIFNEESGKRSHVTQSNFFSVQGCKTSNL